MHNTSCVNVKIWMICQWEILTEHLKSCLNYCCQTNTLASERMIPVVLTKHLMMAASVCASPRLALLQQTFTSTPRWRRRENMPNEPSEAKQCKICTDGIAPIESNEAPPFFVN